MGIMDLWEEELDSDEGSSLENSHQPNKQQAISFQDEFLVAAFSNPVSVLEENPENSSTTATIPVNETYKKFRYPTKNSCSSCPFAAANKKALNRHIKSKHRNEKPGQENTGFKCKRCEHRTYYWKDMFSHSLLHNEKKNGSIETLTEINKGELLVNDKEKDKNTNNHEKETDDETEKAFTDEEDVVNETFVDKD